MERYLTQTIDKAEPLEEWVQKLVEETNRNLDGSQLYDVNLCIRELFQLRGQKYNSNGFVGMYIKFALEEPDFLTEGDKEAWYSRMKELAEKRFGLDFTCATELEYASIPFEEPSEEESYMLTPHKESTIRAGFDGIRRFVKLYCSAVKGHDNVVQAHNERMQQYLVALEILSE